MPRVIELKMVPGGSAFGGIGGASDGFFIRNPEITQMLRELVLDEYQSKPSLTQTAQTSSKRISPELWDPARLKHKKHSLADTMSGYSRKGVKSANLTSEYFDNARQHSTISKAIKDRFNEQRIKNTAVYPEDFKIHVDCKQFKVSEIKAAIQNGFVVVHAKHDHKFDEHGIVKREFKRRWRIPDDVKRDTISALLDRHGILIIQARRKPTKVSVPVQIEKLDY